MKQLEFVKDEEVVFCPEKYSSRLSKYRGACGVIISRQVGGSKKKVKSILVKWRSHRRGVSCFRIRGKARAKSDSATAYWKTGRLSITADEVSRFEEEIKDLHPLSYCHDCPLRLHRLVAPCPLDKNLATENR